MNIGDLVLYKNNQLIAFNKPVALPVQADKTGDKSLVDLAEIYTKSKLELVHRLDRPASGLTLLAKTPKAVVELNAQFQAKSIRKTYLAVVRNAPPEETGTLIHYLRKDGKKNLSRAFSEPVAHSKKAELRYEIIAKSEQYHLLKVDLITGRHHQIRAQLAAIGCPIRGDVKYGFKRGNKDRSIQLHAWRMAFHHPVSKELVELEAPLPEGNIWLAFADQLSKE